jgi:RNA polymerase sigma-70 factor (ECF subfamily)
MRKNGLARLEANTVAHGVRAWAGRWFRRRPVVPDSAFQDPSEPYPGHWREFPQEWPEPVTGDQLREALATLPHTWRVVLLRHDGPSGHTADDAVAAESGLSVAQERDILTAARAALRDALDAAQRRAAR